MTVATVYGLQASTGDAKPCQRLKGTLTAVATATLLIGTPPGVFAQALSPAERWGPRVVYEPTDKVEVISDIVYAQYEQGRTLKLDLYLPRDRPSQPIPGIIVIRGGGWYEGDKEGFALIASRLAEGGFAAASIEYRTSQEAPFPAAVDDVKAATRWMRANAKVYGIDDKALGAIGGSAGAHLAILLATSHGVSGLEGPDAEANTSSQIQAAVGMATPSTLTDFVGRPIVQTFLAVSRNEHPETWALASPISHVDQTDPPLLLLHSDADKVIPYQQSVKLAQRYKAVGAMSEVFKIPNAPHAFWDFSTWFDDALTRAIAFFHTELSRVETDTLKKN
jgi:acetyl esterase/lipase